MMKVMHTEFDFFRGATILTLECGEKVELPVDEFGLAFRNINDLNKKYVREIEELKQWKDKAIALDAETMHMSGEIIRLNNENKNLRITINKLSQLLVGDDS